MPPLLLLSGLGLIALVLLRPRLGLACCPDRRFA